MDTPILTWPLVQLTSTVSGRGERRRPSGPFQCELEVDCSVTRRQAAPIALEETYFAVSQPVQMKRVHKGIVDAAPPAGAVPVERNAIVRRVVRSRLTELAPTSFAGRRVTHLTPCTSNDQALSGRRRRVRSAETRSRRPAQAAR